MSEEQTIRELYQGPNQELLVFILLGLFRKIEALEGEVEALKQASTGGGNG